jgi:hypothetical protein
MAHHLSGAQPSMRRLPPIRPAMMKFFVNLQPNATRAK